MRNKKRLLVGLCAGALVAVHGLQAGAATVAVTNASFETAGDPPLGWIGGATLYNSQTNYVLATTSGTTYLRLAGNYGNFSSSQQTSHVVQNAGEVITLTVNIGAWMGFQEQVAQYYVGLVNVQLNGVTVASNTAASTYQVAWGQFGQATTTYTTTVADVGKTVAILLGGPVYQAAMTPLPNNGNEYWKTFDNVQLDVTAPSVSTLVSDDFSGNGLSPQWFFLDSDSAGSSWNLTTDTAAPLSNTVLAAAKATTQAVQQWDPTTLVNVGDFIQFSFSTRTTATQSSGSFSAAIFNTTTGLNGSEFGYSSYPLAAANGYQYTQAYGAVTPSLQRLTNNSAATLTTATSGAVIGNSSGHTVVVRITRQSSGISASFSIDGVATSATDSSPSSYVFNSIRIDAGGKPAEIDNVSVVSNVASTNFHFSLPHAYFTSAGVYDSSGNLVRTLWRKKTFPSGSYNLSWNNTNDSGTVMPSGNYTVKLLYHHMAYTWEGTVGNTSSSFTGSHVWRSLIGPSNVSIDSSGNAIATVGYNEGQSGVKRWSVSDSQTPSDSLAADQNTCWNFVATDGTSYYLANTGSGWDGNNNTFIVRYNVSDNSAATFLQGTTVSTTGGSSYASAIDGSTEVGSPPTFDRAFITAHAASGLAVQQSGTLLAVAHQGQNQVRIFNKTTGTAIRTLSVSSPGQVAFAPSGDLWVLSGTTALRYTNLLTTPTVATTISGLSAPLAVAVNPTNSDVVLVADGGASQQVKCYNAAGVSQWTLGQSGGYANGVNVTTGKFLFLSYDSNVAPVVGNGVPMTYLAFQSDGSFWVGDPGNCRVLHFSSGRSYQGQIAYLPDRQNMTADPNNPTRLFSGFLEFQVDYTKPLLPGDPDTTLGGNGSWKLVRNWAINLDLTRYSLPDNVITLSNGRTYAQVNDLQQSLVKTFVELPSTGFARPTGITINDNYWGYNLYDNGDLRYRTESITGNVLTQTLFRQTLSGFDGSGNPQWNSASTLASVPINLTDSSYPAKFWAALDPWPQSGWGMTARLPITSSNRVICYNANHSNSHPNCHLGAVTIGSTNFLWRSSPGQTMVLPDGLGTFEDTPGNGGHDGIATFTNGNDVVYGYDGQYANYSCQFMHFDDGGLFVGQFGTTIGTQDDWIPPDIAAPGAAGNIATMTMVNSGGTKYVYCVDEAEHAGVHRWRLDGSLRYISASGAMGSALDLGTAATWDTTNLVSNPGFEAEAATYTLSRGLNATVLPQGWQVDCGSDGSGASAFSTEWTESYAHSLPYHARIAKNGTYSVRPFQILTGLSNGTYQLSAWVQSSGGQTSASLYCKKTPLSGTIDYSTPITATSTWQQVTVSNISVTNGQAEIGFSVSGGSGQYLYLDDVSFAPQ